MKIRTPLKSIIVLTIILTVLVGVFTGCNNTGGGITINKFMDVSKLLTDHDVSNKNNETSVVGSIVSYDKSETANEIDRYIQTVPSKTKFTLIDTESHTNKVNDMAFLEDYSVLYPDISITTHELVEDKDYDVLKKGINQLPVLGGSNNVYPGALISSLNESAYGLCFNVSLNRSGGEFKVSSNNNVSQFSVDTVSKESVEAALKEKVNTINNVNYEVQVAEYTSPEQLSLELGISAFDAIAFSHQYSEDVASGKKQVVFVTARQLVCTVEYTSDLSRPSTMFTPDTTLEQVEDHIKSAMPAQYVKGVAYGKEYLISAVIDNNTTYDSTAQNGFRENADLTNALSDFFSSNRINLSAEQQEVLSRANYSIAGIGGNYGNKWSTSQPTSLDDALNEMYRNRNYIGTGSLVPLFYIAYTLGTTQEQVTIETHANKYKNTRITGVTLNCKFDTDETSSNVSKKMYAWGIDLEEFNLTQKIVEKQYCSTDHAGEKYNFPAYQCVFGVSFEINNKGNNTKIVTKDRLVHGGTYNVDANGENAGLEKIESIDFNKGIKAYCCNTENLAELELSGIRYTSTNGYSLEVSRDWKASKNGADLKYVSTNNTNEEN